MESSSNFPFYIFRVMRSERGSQCRVILLFFIKTGSPWSWEGVINNHIGTASIKQHCPRQTKPYGHPTFACFIRRVIQCSFGDYVLSLWVDLLGLTSNLVTYKLVTLILLLNLSVSQLLNSIKWMQAWMGGEFGGKCMPESLYVQLNYHNIANWLYSNIKS